MQDILRTKMYNLTENNSVLHFLSSIHDVIQYIYHHDIHILKVERVGQPCGLRELDSHVG